MWDIVKLQASLFAAFSDLNSTLIRRVPPAWHIATLQVKAGLTLMMNLNQVCLFFNLITAPTQWCEFWVSVVGIPFFTNFKVVIFWRMIRNSKGVGASNIKYQIGRIKYQGGVFFYFLSVKTYVTFCSCHSFFSIYYTKREMARIKLMTVLLL